MSFYLSQIISVFLLPAVLFGILWQKTNKKHYKIQFWLFVCAVLVGSVTFKLLPFSQVNVLVISTAYSIALVLLFFYALFFKVNGFFLLFWQTLVITLASFMWAKIAKLEMLSVISVINTEFILNTAALFTGFFLISFIHVMTSKIISGQGQLLRKLVITALIILALLPLSGEIILASMKLQILDLTQGLLSYVSKVTNFYWIYSYCVIALSSLCLIALYRQQISPLKAVIPSIPTAIERRKSQAKLKHYLTLVKNHTLGLCLLLISLLYWDMIASQPLQRSPATRIELANDNFVHLSINEEMMDGKIHRFDWVASDGKVVRFFIIDRYPGEQKFGVVFDACMLCGDAGYSQSGDQVLCLACGVHIFIPSIGKPGGCNPIPIPNWQRKGNEILVSKKTLESGLQYFSDIVEIMATDPVSGQQLSNINAEHSYLFGGKTYFFTSIDSYNTFRADPWKYSTNNSVEQSGDK